ncbi:MAG: hypothetical protein PHD19_09355 [Dechloromonas sp.]|nr:hypothetical protein [Dechloromonas sp.]
MTMLDDWLRVPYVAYGRTMAGADCWGLVRIVRHALRGEWLPEFGAVAPDDKAKMTGAAGQVVAAGFAESAPSPGAIAAVWRGPLCLHVGIVIEADGRLAVLETNRATGPRWLRLADFSARYLRVTYHDKTAP